MNANVTNLIWRRQWRNSSMLMCAAALAACAGSPPQSNIDMASVAKGETTSALHADWQRGPFIEIFVRAYADSNGDGIGDFRGLTQKLDYLQQLGVRGIWLMPINPNEDGDHGYAVTDYRAIAPEYGTLADFDEFIKQAHARGIGVIMDYVINHSATQHPIFLQSASSKTSPFRDWYLWFEARDPGWQMFGNSVLHPQPSGFYLGQFHHSMPDFNLKNEAVMRYHLDSLHFWLNRGVDGFRFDAVTHLVENGPGKLMDQPENYEILKRIRTHVDQYANRFVVCEGTGDSPGYGRACGSAFAFGLNGDVIKAVNGDGAALKKVADYFAATNPNLNMATLLANHDEFAGRRLWDQFDGDLVRYKLAATTLLLMPGIPFIYYGEEIGMNAGAGLKGDPSLRSPMSWRGDAVNAGFASATVKPFRATAGNALQNNVEMQVKDSNSLLAHYQALMALRTRYPALLKGSYEHARVDGSLLRFERSAGSQRIAVFINFGDTEARTQVTGATSRTSIATIFPAHAADVTTDSRGGASLVVAARSARVLMLSQ